MAIPCHGLVPKFKAISRADPVSVDGFGRDRFPRVENGGSVFGDDGGEISEMDGMHGQRRDSGPEVCRVVSQPLCQAWFGRCRRWRHGTCRFVFRGFWADFEECRTEIQCRKVAWP